MNKTSPAAHRHLLLPVASRPRAVDAKSVPTTVGTLRNAQSPRRNGSGAGSGIAMPLVTGGDELKDGSGASGEEGSPRPRWEPLDWGSNRSERHGENAKEMAADLPAATSETLRCTL